jgi:agmatine deiminase
MIKLKPVSVIFFLLLFYTGNQVFSQAALPAGFAPWELNQKLEYTGTKIASAYDTPPVSAVRASAEWEEIEALMVVWTSYIPTVREIVKYARLECKVYVICSDSNAVKSDLTSNDIPLDNVYYLEVDYNSIWCRDFGQWNVYTNKVDSLLLVDWIYNRPRPLDDAIPGAIAEETGLPLYQTITPPYDLVATGGNFMTDGWGTGFSSNLILDENDGTDFSITPKTEAQIDSIMKAFMGIERYVKMEALPYDVIHHIDMHLKLLDEETLLVGEYPEDVADGPQIEENLQYILDNYQSVFGTPYKVVRIPMPPDASNDYPDSGGAYRTFTNCVFVNKTVLVPYYEVEFDTTAYRILSENLPGYKIVGINCNSIINALGAIHCITKEVAVQNPLLITHQPLPDTDNSFDDYEVNAWILYNQAIGVESAQINYSTDTAAGWNQADMVLTDALSNTWTGYIPAQPAGTRVYYYIQATAADGKQQQRPITAPLGFWNFDVGNVVAVNNLTLTNDAVVSPNPFSTEWNITFNEFVTAPLVQIIDMAGRCVYQQQFAGHLSILNFNNGAALPNGTYFVKIIGADNIYSLKLVKQN